jgi:hypothetical protein
MINNDKYLSHSILDFFRQGLRLSIVSKEEIIKWADFHLLNNTLKDYIDILVELSLSKSKTKSEITALISENIGTESTTLGSRFSLGKLFKLNNKENTLSKLGQLIEFMKLSEIEENFIEDLYYDYEYKKSLPYSNQKEFPEEEIEALKFLKNYENFNIDNINQYEDLEKKLFEQLHNTSNSGKVIIDIKEKKQQKDPFNQTLKNWFSLLKKK